MFHPHHVVSSGRVHECSPDWFSQEPSKTCFIFFGGGPSPAWPDMPQHVGNDVGRSYVRTYVRTLPVVLWCRSFVLFFLCCYRISPSLNAPPATDDSTYRIVLYRRRQNARSTNPVVPATPAVTSTTTTSSSNSYSGDIVRGARIHPFDSADVSLGRLSAAAAVLPLLPLLFLPPALVLVE